MVAIIKLPWRLRLRNFIRRMCGLPPIKVFGMGVYSGKGIHLIRFDPNIHSLSGDIITVGPLGNEEIRRP